MFKTGDIVVLLDQGSYYDGIDPIFGVKGQCAIVEPRPNWMVDTEEFIRLVTPREGQKPTPFPTYRERLEKL